LSRQSLSSSQPFMQNVRSKRAAWMPWEAPQAGSSCESKPTHTASGQVSGSQLKIVQYPSGCVVSQSRSPSCEQSVESVHLFPIFGAQPAATRSAATGKTQPSRDSRKSMEAPRTTGPRRRAQLDRRRKRAPAAFQRFSRTEDGKRTSLSPARPQRLRPRRRVAPTTDQVDEREGREVN